MLMLLRFVAILNGQGASKNKNIRKKVKSMAAEYLNGRRVVHVRKDGTRQDSMDGVEVPKNISDLVMKCVYEGARELERKKAEGEKVII